MREHEPLSPLTLYYDGACHLCSREIDHYRKLDTGLLSFVDISDPNFQREDSFPSYEDLNKWFHVQLPSGEFVGGVDAFIEIWKRLPRYRWAAQLSQISLVHGILSSGYRVFAEIRPWLPKKKSAPCSDGHCTSRV